MRRLIFTIAAGMLAASVSAETVYDGLAEDNPDLRGQVPQQPMTGEESTTTTETPPHQGLAEDNPDLVGELEKTGPSGERPDIYQEAKPNPDLKY